MRNTEAMERGRCQPLQQRWLAVVQEYADAPAVHLVAEGKMLTFAELHAAAASLPPSQSLVRAQGQRLPFLLEVLRAWRDDAVLMPVEAAADAVPRFPNLPAEVCHLKTTSGSSGAPRYVLFTADQLAADADQIVRTMGLRQEWPNVAVISLAHSYGFSNLVLPLLLHGIPMVIGDGPLPQAMRKSLASGSYFTLAAVPAMWRAWHAAGLISNRIRLAISAGAPLPLDLERGIFAASGVKIHNFYGSSECGGIAYDRTSLPREASWLTGTAMDGVTLAVDEVDGCLTVSSAAVGVGYIVADPALSQGRFHTSDRVRITNGEVWLEGRTGEAINIAGRKVSPSVIEEILTAMPGVRHCVVFGIPSPDEAKVDEIAVCVNLSGCSTLEEVRQAGAHLLPDGRQPRHWRVCPDLEPDERGKISRAAWRERWLREA